MAAKAKLRVIPGTSPDSVICAIYTRKSTEEGLDQDFNSLDAQRESAEYLISSRRLEGWIASSKRYDDGGYTGANMDRPALKELFADIEAGTVNCVVVYKYDRLSRSMSDFMKILERLERHQATFVSVTEPFDTRTPQGKFVVNMLLSFAELERATTAERTRDKVRAARRKGKFIGGNLILGYDVAPKGGALVVNTAEAEQVRTIFRLYLEFGSLIPVVEELERRGMRMKRWTTREGRTRGGASFNKTTLHNMLTNVAYTGHVRFEGKLLEGEHKRIIDDETFNRVQEQRQRNGRKGGRSVRNKGGGLLKGLVRCGSCGGAMMHTYSQKRETRYRYYVCITAHQRGWNACETKSVPAPLLESAVVENLRRFAQQPAMLSGVLRRLEEMRREANETTMAEPASVQNALQRFDPLWEQLTTWEQERFIRALVAEVMQRCHQQDLSGHLLAQGGWDLLCLPAEYEGPMAPTSIGFIDPRDKIGALLWAERFGPVEIEALKISLGSYGTAGQLQQRPSPAGGGIFKRHWFRYWQPRGANLPPVLVRMPDGTLRSIEAIEAPQRVDEQIQSWDCSFKDLLTSDYVVGQVWAHFGGMFLLGDQVRARMDCPATLQAIRGLSEKWPATIAKLIEDKANGSAVIQMLGYEIPGLLPVNPQGGKVARAQAIAPLVEAGNVYLPHPDYAPWVNDFIEECVQFPNGTYDDQVDAMTQALLRWQMAPVETTYVCLVPRVQISPI